VRRKRPRCAWAPSWQLTRGGSPRAAWRCAATRTVFDCNTRTAFKF
jgi:hypothetical protein